MKVKPAWLLLALVASGCDGDIPGARTPPVPPAAHRALLEEPSESAPEPGRCEARRAARISPLAPHDASSEIALARAEGGEQLVFVADEDARALHVVDAGSLVELGVTELPGRPKHVRVLADGRVAVTLGDVAKVVVLEPAATFAEPLEQRCEATVAAEPWSIAERGRALLVTSGFGAALTTLDQRDLGVVRVTALPREPRAILVEGSAAYVSHAAFGDVSVVDLDAGGRTSISLRAGHRVGPEELEKRPPRDANQAYTLVAARTVSEDGSERLRLLAPHVSVDAGELSEPITTGYGGTRRSSRPVASIVSTVDPILGRSLTREVANNRLDASARDCLLPRGAALHGARLYVACMDIDAVVAYDASLGDPASLPLARLETAPQPTSVAVLGDRLFVWSGFARELARFELPTGAKTSMNPWDRADHVVDAARLRGRYLFSSSMDARIADGRACASCHPEGRDDGLVWTSPDGRRQTPMLAGRLEGTAPYGWFGEHATVEAHVKDTIDRLGGEGFSDPADREALLGYVRGLTLPASPPPADVALVRRGHDVFESTGCAVCHAGGSSDAVAHDVGSGAKGERSGRFDTPSLRGLRGSAPYFHDGRYASLDALLGDPNSKMFMPERLADEDRGALVSYLESL